MRLSSGCSARISLVWRNWRFTSGHMSKRMTIVKTIRLRPKLWPGMIAYISTSRLNMGWTIRCVNIVKLVLFLRFHYSMTTGVIRSKFGFFKEFYYVRFELFCGHVRQTFIVAHDYEVVGCCKITRQNTNTLVNP